ncbi:hypothetical protein ABZV52_15755 [Streptomyces sp. NPDC004735]
MGGEPGALHIPGCPARRAADVRREAATVEAVRSAWTAQLIEASLDAPP